MQKRITPLQEIEVKRLYGQKFSAPIISKKLSLTLSQVYKSLNKQGIKRRKPKEQSQITFANKPLSFKYKYPITNNSMLLEVAGLMLYKGEGAKTGFTVDFANSDPIALKIFLNFLRKICCLEEKRIRIYLYSFSNQNQTRLISYWSKQLLVNKELFTKPYVRMFTMQKNNRSMKKGLVHIRYSDKKLLNFLLARIDQITKKMIK